MSKNTCFRTTNIGYPRIGDGRQHKRLLENLWNGTISENEFRKGMAIRQAECLEVQERIGVDIVPCGDFSVYDHVLDTAITFGCIPDRFGWSGASNEIDLDLYFALARGRKGAHALELTKWFNTNYHYLVPEFPKELSITGNSPFAQSVRLAEKVVGNYAKPVMLGPLTFLKLAGLRGSDLKRRADEISELYRAILLSIRALGVQTFVQFDEPILVTDIGEDEISVLRKIYEDLATTGVPICIQTYYGHIAPLWNTITTLPVSLIGVDLVCGYEKNMKSLLRFGIPDDKGIILGVVAGRNIWKSNLVEKYSIVETIAEKIDPERILLSPSCSLLHLPETVSIEDGIPDKIKNGFCFAQERLGELVLLKKALNHGIDSVCEDWDTHKSCRVQCLNNQNRHNPFVQERVRGLVEGDFKREDIAKRRKAQNHSLKLPILPTTTIGSFPQTDEIRRARKLKMGNPSGYRAKIEEEIRRVIRLQEEIGLDVLVDGESYRTDMTRYFAENLKGYVLPENGWVQSYGNRCVRPPVIYGDIFCEGPITVGYASYTQSLTEKPVKGMLTGPVTLLKWSFPREDLSEKDALLQLALVVRDEAIELEKAGIQIIQIDEAAFREGLPLRETEQDKYLNSAVQSFRLASSGVSKETQIHTHMCYSDFSTILEAIGLLDVDVISIEDARSGGRLAGEFASFGVGAQLGAGVWDIHSKVVPSVQEIEQKIRGLVRELEVGKIWVNPDCGLKTRRYEEVIPALRNMIEATSAVRKSLK